MKVRWTIQEHERTWVEENGVDINVFQKGTNEDGSAFYIIQGNVDNYSDIQVKGEYGQLHACHVYRQGKWFVVDEWGATK